ncbi:hypothetical protein A2U01_0115320, partial [Trifolium medium]|nr:hypothetical protein [Trifolium medium]
MEAGVADGEELLPGVTDASESD